MYHNKGKRLKKNKNSIIPKLGHVSFRFECLKRFLLLIPIERDCIRPLCWLIQSNIGTTSAYTHTYTHNKKKKSNQTFWGRL